MKLIFDYANMTSAAIGGRGVNLDDIGKDADSIQKTFAKVMDNKGKGMMEWTSLPFASEEQIHEITSYCSSIRKKADAFVVLGIGGSALGLHCAANALLHLYHNRLTRKKRENAPRLYVEDNIDPERMAALFDVIDIKKTWFNFITKSGETCETLSQFLIIYEVLKRVLGAKKARERIIVTTTEGKGSLYDVAVKENFKMFGIPKGAGGRFSVLSAVGLVPMAALGIDIKMLLKGAAEMDETCSNPDISKNPAFMTAYLMQKSMQAGKNISVMMPYSEALKYMADFYAQLWAESLGKAVDNDGKTVNCGQTPVKSLGTTDQHSQIQLYTQGPFDKVVTFLAVEEFREKVLIPDDTDVTDFAYLKGRDLAEVFTAERNATAYALTKAGRSNLTITLPCICEYTVGELLTYFMYQTVFAGALLNINAFDQPGVEEGKEAAYAMMGRAGYEDMLEEIKKTAIKDYVIQDEE